MNKQSDEQKVVKLNLRASPELMARIDQRRAEMLHDQRYATIPSRSEFVRLAVEAFVEQPIEKKRGR